MTSSVKDLVRGAFARMGYRITRLRPANRFDALTDSLLLMRNAGYAPRVVIDAGCNMGRWTMLVRPIFPDVAFHLIEPQPQCAEVLRALVASTPGLTLHRVAVSEPGITRLRMLGGGEEGGTGGRVAGPGERGPDEIECPATTLDALLGDRLEITDRALLKLDLEGHELCALRGGSRVLELVEAVFTEVRFYDINDAGKPVFDEVLGFLRDKGFELYDFAALFPRPRDMRLCMGDAVFVPRRSPLLADRAWE